MLAPLAGRIYHHAPQQNAVPLGRPMKEILAATVLSVLLAPTARADSDGYFCVGKGYIAYQFGLAAPPVAPHRLTIVRYGDSGLQKPRVVELPQFQVHGMDCAAGVVRIASFDSIYTVRLDSAPRVIGRVAIPATERGHFPTKVFVQRNLASLNKTTSSMKTDRVVLGTVKSGRSFELVMVPKPTKKPCTVLLESEIVEFGPTKRAGTRIPVFRGDAYRACGQ